MKIIYHHINAKTDIKPNFEIAKISPLDDIDSSFYTNQNRILTRLI